MDEILKAKKLYEELADIPERFRDSLGPTMAVPPSRQADFDRIRREALQMLPETPPRQDEGTMVVDVPSAWHAYLMCLMIQSESLSQGVHMLFRGHRDSRWPLQPSLWRPNVDVPMERRAATRFTDALAGSLDVVAQMQLDPMAHVGSAQHYGIKTELLDFTPDPAVALAFASMRTDGTPEWPTATVLMTATNRAVECGARIFLPPPYVERLYRQLGCFVQIPLGGSDVLKGTLPEIRFPAQHAHGPFEVRRDRMTIDLLVDDPWLSELRTWAYAPDSRPDALPESGDLDLFLMRVGYPAWTKIGDGGILMLARWYELIEDLLYWLVLRHTSEGTTATQPILERLITDNPHLLGWFALTIRGLFRVKLIDDPSKEWLGVTILDVLKTVRPDVWRMFSADGSEPS